MTSFDPVTPEGREQLRELSAHLDGLGGDWYVAYDEEFNEASIRAEEPDGSRNLGSYVEVARTSQWPDDLESSPAAEFIAASRNRIGELLDAIEEQQRRIEELEAEKRQEAMEYLSLDSENHRLDELLKSAESRIAAVRALHGPEAKSLRWNEGWGIRECFTCAGERHPCPTTRTLDGEVSE